MAFTPLGRRGADCSSIMIANKGTSKNRSQGRSPRQRSTCGV